MKIHWERCPSHCRDEKGRERWLFKVRIENGKVWLCCWVLACPWKVELTGDAAKAFLG